MGKVILEGMEFFAYHGCFHEEKIIGTHFRVSLDLTLDTEQAEHTDDLSDTVDYQSVYRIVRHEMEQKSNLLEHVAARIADAVMLAFPVVSHLSVILSKLNPPLGGKVNAVTCIVNR